MIFFITKLRLPEERGLSAAIMAKCRAYHEIGQKVELISPARQQPSKSAARSLWKYYEISPGLFPHRLLNSLEFPIIPFAEPIISHLRHLVMSWVFSLNCLTYIWQRKPDIVHFYDECLELLFLLRLTQIIFSPKIVCEVHYENRHPYYLLLAWTSLPRANLICTTTNHLRTVCLKLSLKLSQVVVMPEGVRLESFNYKASKTKLRSKLGLPLKKFIIGYAGTFITNGMEKGIPELIEAFSIVRKSYPNILLLCVGGPTEYVQKYQHLASKMGLSADIHIKDRVSPKKLYEYFRAFDICSLPFPKTHHFSYNMSPIKLFESMASKNPILATNLPSIKEIVSNRISAILVEPGDINSLSQGIVSLLRDKSLAKKISNRAFEDVKGQYTLVKRSTLILKKLAG